MTGKEFPLQRASRAALDVQRLRQSCAECGLHRLCLPASIGGDDLQQLERVVQVKRVLGRDQSLYSVGRPFHALYVVRSGAFKTFSTDSHGESQVLGFHLPGEIMGLDAIASGQHQCTRRGAREIERL